MFFFFIVLTLPTPKTCDSWNCSFTNCGLFIECSRLSSLWFGPLIRKSDLKHVFEESNESAVIILIIN